MAVTEKTIQEAFQTALRALSNFADADVTINDWSVLDGSVDNAPYVIIENADDWDSVQQTVTAVDNMRIPFTLVVKLAADTWKTALDNFRDARQAIKDCFQGTGRSAFGYAGVYIPRIRPDGPVGYIYSPDVDPEQQPYATPLFISQRMIAEVEEF